MANINRDYLVILDVKSGSINAPTMKFMNTDKSTSNIYVQLVVKQTTIVATPIQNATDFTVKANIVKNKNIAKFVDGVLVNEEDAIYEFDLPSDCTDLSGNYLLEFVVTAAVDGVNESITSTSATYTVGQSILTGLDSSIEDSSDYPILKQLIDEVRELQANGGGGSGTGSSGHTHSNKTVLDGITSAKVNHWDTAYTHSQTAHFSGDYNDLTNKPTIPEAVETYVHPDTHPASMITGLANVATSGSYTDLTNTPAIPTNTSDLTNNSGFATETYVTNAIANAQLGGGEGTVDLSGYVTKEVGNADQITFSDGQTFQQKLDAGTLRGEQGPQGLQGIQGPQGERGEKGDPGEQGPQGPAGADGYTPVKGVDYFDGEKGDKGDKGEKGDKGDPGEQGPQGERGETGPQGEQGLQGPAGATTASGVSITDTGNYFTNSDVEGALQEVGSQIKEIENEVNNIVAQNSMFVTKSLTTSEIASIIGTTPDLPTNIEVTSITASSNYLSINVGETRQITYTLLPEGATTTVTYSSSDPTVCSVDQQGNINALKSGDILITLTCSNGIKTDCQVVVSEVTQQVDVTSISLDKTDIKLGLNERSTIVATVLPLDATNKSITWESNNTDVATVVGGVVTGINSGSCVITCKSISNPSISATCNITVQEIVSLTSVTDGLQHSYNLTNLNGDSTYIDDLTGNVPLSLNNFGDVVSAKTEFGIVTDSSTCEINQGNVSSATGKYTIVVTVKGIRDKSQGIFSTSNVKVGTDNINTDLCVVTSSFLGRRIPTTYNENKFDTIICTFDFETEEIVVYSNGVRMSTISIAEKGITWNNSIKFNDGYWGGASGICYKNILFYNRCITDSEAATITSEINNTPYTNLNTANSTLVIAQDNIIEHFSSSNGIDGTVKNSLVSPYTLQNVSANDSEGFLLESPCKISQQLPYKTTYIVRFKTDATNTQKNILALADEYYIYLSGSKIYFRTGGNWIFPSAGVDFTFNDDINVLYIESEKDLAKFYINNELIYTIKNNTYYFDMLDNTAMKITDFILLNGVFDENTRTSIYNELVGGSISASTFSLSKTMSTYANTDNLIGKHEAIVSPSNTSENPVITLPFNVATSIYFKDGKTLQQKYDLGELGSSSGNNTNAAYVPNKWYGKKIVCLGDSITASGYPIYIGEVLGAIIDNRGSSGGTYDRDWEIIQNIDWTYVDGVTYMTGQNNGGGGDITIEGSGLYDIADWTNYDSYPSNYFAGVAKVINYIRAQNPNIRIYLLGQANSGQLPLSQNTAYAIKLKMEALSEFLSVPFIDTYSHSGINHVNWRDFSTDGVHINETGRKLVGYNAGYEMMYL